MEVLQYRINRMADFIVHCDVYDNSRITQLLYLYWDVHLPLVYAIAKNGGRLPKDWKGSMWDPDVSIPCHEGSLPNVVSLLPRCTTWGEAKETARQFLIDFLTKTFPKRCNYRCLGDMTVQYCKSQYEEYAEQTVENWAKLHPLSANLTEQEQTAWLEQFKVETAAVLMQMNDLPHKSTDTKNKTYFSLPCEKIPESDDVLEMLRRLMLCTLLGGYTHARNGDRVHFTKRLELYTTFAFEVDRIKLLRWLCDHEDIQFYALKEFLVYALPWNVGMMRVIERTCDWKKYADTTIDGCNRHIREVLVRTNSLVRCKKFLVKLRKEQLKNVPRRFKPPFPNFVMDMLRKAVKTEDIAGRIGLIPPSKHEALQSIIPRFRPEEDIDYSLLLAFGLSKSSMEMVLSIRQCHLGLLADTKLVRDFLPKMTPYAWGMTWLFMEAFVQCFRVRLFTLPQHWYEAQIRALRMRLHVPPGMRLPDGAGELLYCHACKNNSVRGIVLPPGTGEHDLRPPPRASKPRKRARAGATAEEKKKYQQQQRVKKRLFPNPDQQQDVGFKNINFEAHNGKLWFFCDKKQNRKPPIISPSDPSAAFATAASAASFGGETQHISPNLAASHSRSACGNQPLMRFRLVGKLLMENGRQTVLCCGCGGLVAFELRYYRGGLYLCAFCQRAMVVMEMKFGYQRKAHQRTLLDLEYEYQWLVREISQSMQLLAQQPLPADRLFQIENNALEWLNLKMKEVHRNMMELDTEAQRLRTNLLPLFFPHDDVRIASNALPMTTLVWKPSTTEHRCSYCNIVITNHEPKFYRIYGGQLFYVCNAHNRGILRRMERTLGDDLRRYARDEMRTMIQLDMEFERMRKASKSAPRLNPAYQVIPTVLKHREQRRRERMSSPDLKEPVEAQEEVRLPLDPKWTHVVWTSTHQAGPASGSSLRVTNDVFIYCLTTTASEAKRCVESLQLEWESFEAAAGAQAATRWHQGWCTRIDALQSADLASHLSRPFETFWQYDEHASLFWAALQMGPKIAFNFCRELAQRLRSAGLGVETFEVVLYAWLNGRNLQQYCIEKMQSALVSYQSSRHMLKGPEEEKEKEKKDEASATPARDRKSLQEREKKHDELKRVLVDEFKRFPWKMPSEATLRPSSGCTRAECRQMLSLQQQCEAKSQGVVCQEVEDPTWSMLPDWQRLQDSMLHCHSGTPWHIWGTCNSSLERCKLWLMCYMSVGQREECPFCKARDRQVASAQCLFLKTPGHVACVDSAFVCIRGHVWATLSLPVA